MPRRVKVILVAVAVAGILAILWGAAPATATESNPHRYWSTERLTPGGVWGWVCYLQGDSLLWSETSPDSPSELWLLDIPSGARSLVYRSERPVADLWEPAPRGDLWGDYVAYTSMGPDAAGPYYADEDLFLMRIGAEGERVRLSQSDDVRIRGLEIDEGYVAWVEEDWGEGDQTHAALYLYSIETKDLTLLVSTDSPDFLNLVFMQEGKLAWSKGASLYIYDIASATGVLVTEGTEGVGASISGDYLAWNQDGTLWLRDLSSGITARVADEVGGFDLSAGYLTWSTFEYLEGDGGPRGDVYLQELSTGVVFRLTADDELDMPPQVSDHWVAWLRGSLGKGGELIAYDLTSGMTSTVAPYAYSFLLDGDRIAWDEYRGKGDAFLAQVGRFSDIPPTHPYRAAIEALASQGITSGYPDGTFRPGSPVIRQQFAKLIVRTLGLEVTGSEQCSFGDVLGGVDPSDPFYPDKYVAVCALHGITRGKTATTFAPYANITRAQLLSMVVRGAAQLDILDDPSPAYYQGTSTGSHVFRAWNDPDHRLSVQTAEFNGLLEGIVPDDSSSLAWDPYKSATRGEVAQILWRLGRKMEASHVGRP